MARLPHRFEWVVLLLGATIALSSCKTETKSPVPPGKLPSGAPAPVRNTAEAPEGGWCVEDGAGSRLVSLEPLGDGFNVCGPEGKSQGQVVVRDDKVELMEQKQLALKVKARNDGCKLYDGRDQVLIEVKRKDNGYLVKDAADKEIGRIKAKDAGAYKVYDAGGAEIGKIKPKDNGLELEDPSDKRLYRVKGKLPARAGAFWGINGLSDQQKVALSVYFSKWE